MNDQRWEEVPGASTSPRRSRVRREEDEETQAVTETVVWTGPQGKMKLARTTRPLVVDKKTHFSNRIGGGTHVEYIYSKTESTSRVRLYRWNEATSDWVELDAAELGVAAGK
jgi:hypothetical protein